MRTSKRGSSRVALGISGELRGHAPFTFAGALSGVAIAIALVSLDVPRSVSGQLFWILHPTHIVLSALTTASMFRMHSRRPSVLSVAAIGYIGSVGIATLSDSLIPYLGEWMLDLPNRGVHLGFIEKWWLVNPLAIGGIALAYVRPTTALPHAGHVLLSTWASLFHMTMALGTGLSLGMGSIIMVFLFLAVWVPCCASDIVFPLLLASPPRGEPQLTKATTRSDDM